MALLAIAGEDPAARARCFNSSPKTKAKLNMEENIPERIQITRPTPKPERAGPAAPGFCSRSRRQPAMRVELVGMQHRERQQTTEPRRDGLGHREAQGQSNPGDPEAEQGDPDAKSKPI